MFGFYKRKFPLKIGSILSWVITVIWCVYIFIISKDRPFPTNLNEIGDFYAGIFAPLAFFWLVRGFYQQSEGLKQNSEALRIQAQELTKSTEALELQVQEMKLALVQQTLLSETTKQDLELSKKSFEYQQKLNSVSGQPFFHINVYSSGNHHPISDVTLELMNSRSICREIYIYYRLYEENSSFRYLQTINYLPDDKIIKLKVINFPSATFDPINESTQNIAQLKFKFLDSLDNPKEYFFELIAIKSQQTIHFKVDRPLKSQIKF